MTLDLNVQTWGEGRPLVILHGLLGSSRNWQGLAKSLARSREVHAVDLRNHGRSPWSETMDYPAMAADVAALARKAGWREFDLLGHSMGGKVAMMLALTDPGALRRLIVLDIAPVSYDHGFEDYIAAMQGIDLAALQRRAEADAELAQAVPDPAIRAFLLQNIDAGEDGKLRWRANLDALYRAMPAITGWPEVAGTPFAGPTMFLHGGRSDYVLPSHRPLVERLFADVRFETIADAGHWVHAEAPKAFLATVGAFLDG